MTKLKHDRLAFPGVLPGVYDNPKKIGRPLRRKRQSRLDLNKLEIDAAKYAREHGVPLKEVRLHWRLDDPTTLKRAKRSSQNGRKRKSTTIVSSAKSRGNHSAAVKPKNKIAARQVPDPNLRQSGPRSLAKMRPARKLSASVRSAKTSSVPKWRPVEVQSFYGDGTSAETYKAQIVVAELDRVVLRVRGVGKFNYRSINLGAGDKIYHLDTDERGRAETLQFVRGRKRLFGTWRSRNSAGGWSIAVCDV
jgi:hypothetical protein